MICQKATTRQSRWRAGRGWMRGVAAAAGISLVLAGCSSNNNGSSSSTTNGNSSQPYQVLDIQGQTGPVGVLGTGAVQAAKYTVQTLNRKGGILGRQIQVDYFDDQTNPVTALSILKRQLSAKHYDFIIAGTSSGENNPMLPTINASKILTMSVAGGVSASGAANPYFFSGSGAETVNPTAVVMYLANKLKVKSVGLLIQSGVAGQSEDAAYTSLFQKAGINVVANVSFDPAAINDTPQVEQVQKANPDVVVVAAFGAAAGYIAQDMTQLGYNPPTIGDLFVAASNISALVPASDLKNWDLAYNASLTRPPSGVSPKLSSFYNALTAQFGTLKASINTYTTTWDMFQLAKWAAETAGTTNGTKDVKALEDISKHSSAKELDLLTFPSYGYSAANHTPVPFDVKEQINPYWQISSASSPEIAGTHELVSTIPDYPTHLVAPNPQG